MSLLASDIGSGGGGGGGVMATPNGLFPTEVVVIACV